MNTVIEFIRSDIGVSIAWLSGVVSFIISFIKIKENKVLKKDIIKLKELNISVREGEVSQNGEKNIYTEKNIGDINIDM